jgi:hypothetical protein
VGDCILPNETNSVMIWALAGLAPPAILARTDASVIIDAGVSTSQTFRGLDAVAMSSDVVARTGKQSAFNVGLIGADEGLGARDGPSRCVKKTRSAIA